MHFSRYIPRRSYWYLLVALSCSSASTEAGEFDWDLWPPTPTRITVGTLQFSGHLSPVPQFAGIHRIVAVLTNPDTIPATIEIGSDSFGARLYASADLAMAPLWDDRPPSWGGLTLPTYTFQVQGRSSLPFETTAFLNHAELQRLLAPGTYHAALTWRSNARGPVSVIGVGTITVASSQ